MVISYGVLSSAANAASEVWATAQSVACRKGEARPDNLNPHQYTSNISGGTFLDAAIDFTYFQKRPWSSALRSLCA